MWWRHGPPLRGGLGALLESVLVDTVGEPLTELIVDAVRMWATAQGLDARNAQIGGATAALLLGSASTFWVQATTAHIRMPTVLFVAWGFRALARYRNAGGSPAPPHHPDVLR